MRLKIAALFKRLQQKITPLRRSGILAREHE